MKICLSITTCKRFELFCRTIISFAKNCKDINQFECVYHYDDSSSEEDRNLMEGLIIRLFPNSVYVKKHINPDDIKSNRRHMEIMKKWKGDTEYFDYVFHLEDDWLFDKEFNLAEAINLMKLNSDVAYVGFSWERKEFPSDIFTPIVIGNFWEWYYSEKYELCEPIFIDKVEMRNLPEGHWIKYINWPYFSFRPGIHDIKKINKLETFNDSMESFELEFSTRFAKLYKSFFYVESVCKHIGLNVSSYELNKSNR